MILSIKDYKEHTIVHESSIGSLTGEGVFWSNSEEWIAVMCYPDG